MGKKKIIVAAFFLLISAPASAQSGWYAVTDSVRFLLLESIQMTSANTGYACGYHENLYDGVIFKTTNGGLYWKMYYDSTKTLDDICFLNDNTGYCIGWKSSPSNYYGCILKTTDGGDNWSLIHSVPSGVFYKIKFYDVNTGLVAGRYGEAYFTTNGGTDWITRTVANIWGEPQDVVFINVNTVLVSDGVRLVRTTNQGANWSLDNSFPASAMFFLNQFTGFTGGGNDGCIYKTTNSGLNWVKIYSTNLGRSVSLVFADENTGYCARSGFKSICKTTDGGYNWTVQIVSAVDYVYALSFINSLTGFAAAYNGRIYRTTNGGSVFVSNISNEVPEKFELGQNYPNPFNQSTIFNLQCSMKSDVCVKVFDAAGREVQTLVNESLAPGTYQVRFDGSGLASGIYFYRMSVEGKQTAVKKMVMMK